MPSNNKGLDLFLQKEPVTDEQLFKLVNLRYSAVKDLLDDFTLRPFNKTMFISNGGGSSDLCYAHRRGEILSNIPFLARGDFQCLVFPVKEFDEEASAHELKYSDLTTTAYFSLSWALDRKGRWLVIKAEYYFAEAAGSKIKRLGNVWIGEAESPETLCAETGLKPIRIIINLFEIIQSWMDAKKALYEHLHHLHQEMLAEHRSLRVLKAI